VPALRTKNVAAAVGGDMEESEKTMMRTIWRRESNEKRRLKNRKKKQLWREML